jgi:chorismate mutase
LWQIAIELRRQLPDLQLLADPSHIAGKRSLVAALAQEALDLDYDGLMIEVHPDPPNAWSDSAQQLTIDEFNNLVDSLLVKSAISTDVEFLNKLEQLRSKIDRIDKEMVKIIAERMKLVDEIGTYKRDNHVTVFQKERWSEIFSTRTDWAKMLELNPALVADIYRLIHDESIKRQTAIVNEAEKSVG